MQCMRLLRPIQETMIVTPVRYGNRMKTAIRLGIKRPSKATLFSPTSRKKPITKGEIDVRKGMTFTELAEKMNMPIEELRPDIQRLVPGRSVSVVDPVMRVERLRDLAVLYGFKVNFRKQLKENEMEGEEDDADEYPRPPADPALCQPRAPVVTIMGHVDHGKTTLLDALRKSRIVDSEFGGITQHIGAFSVRLKSLPGRPRITFLDTPGHAAFSAMRQRGADCTDIVVLVVAADDGVMPQTEESVRFAAIADVPIIVAVNKIDAPGADPERVTKELMYKAGLLLEESGGDVQCVHISALKQRNLDALQEAIVVQAEMMDLRAETDGPVQAVVLEAETKKGRGKVATCLVQRGTLKTGAHLVAGTAVCRVRAIFNEDGRRVTSAGPSDPVEVMGWRELPETGDVVLQVKDEARATEVQELRESELMEEKAEEDGKAYSESMSEYRSRYQQWLAGLNEAGTNTRFWRRKLKHQRPQRDADEGGEIPKLNIMVKGDVLGSVEAISDMVAQIQGSHLYELNLVDEEVGEVTDSDLELAEVFDAIIYAFNIPVSRKTKEKAVKRGVEIREFNVIYHLAHDLREEILTVIPAVAQEQELGSATILKMFKVNKEGSRKKFPVAGCVCDSGTLRHDALFRVYRSRANVADAIIDDDYDDVETLIFDGPCESLYRGSQMTKSVNQKAECGIMLLGKGEEDLPLLPGDRIQCYEVVNVKPELDLDFNFN